MENTCYLKNAWRVFFLYQNNLLISFPPEFLKPTLLADFPSFQWVFHCPAPWWGGRVLIHLAETLCWKTKSHSRVWGCEGRRTLVWALRRAISSPLCVSEGKCRGRSCYCEFPFCWNTDRDPLGMSHLEKLPPPRGEQERQGQSDHFFVQSGPRQIV